MVIFYDVLTKNNCILDVVSNKHDFSSQHFKSNELSICTIYPHVLATFFDVNKFTRVSKKLRSNIVETYQKDIFEYSYRGVVITMRRDYSYVNVTILLRNVTAHITFQYFGSVYSAQIDGTDVETKKKYEKNTRNRARLWIMKYKSQRDFTIELIFVNYIHDFKKSLLDFVKQLLVQVVMQFQSLLYRIYQSARGYIDYVKTTLITFTNKVRLTLHTFMCAIKRNTKK